MQYDSRDVTKSLKIALVALAVVLDTNVQWRINHLADGARAPLFTTTWVRGGSHCCGENNPDMLIVTYGITAKKGGLVCKTKY